MKYIVIGNSGVWVLVAADTEARRAFGITDSKCIVEDCPDYTIGTKATACDAWIKRVRYFNSRSYNLSSIYNGHYVTKYGELPAMRNGIGYRWRLQSEFQSFDAMAEWMGENEDNRIVVGVCPITNVLLWMTETGQNFKYTVSRNAFRDMAIHRVWRPLASYASRIFLCSKCGAYHRVDERGKIGNDYLCESCASEEGFKRCEMCGSYHKMVDMASIDGYILCKDCLTNKTFTCSVCGMVHLTQFRRFDGDVAMCEACYNKSHPQCDYCGNRGDVVDMGWGKYLCHNCIETHQKVHEDEQIGYHDYRTIAYLANEKRLKDEPPSTRYFGVELETEEVDKDDLCISSFTESNNIHMEEDGSLGDYGVEFISAPCSLGYHKSEFDWQDFCYRIRSAGAISHNTESCGLHVHVTRASVKPSTIAKLNVILNRCLPSLSRTIARRNSIYSGNYDRRKKLAVADGFYRDIPKFISGRLGYIPSRIHCERYVPLNLTNESTIEFRVFKGTTNYQTLLASIEYCDAMIEYADACEIPNLNKSEEYHTKAFLDFVKGYSEKYPDILPTVLRLNRQFCPNDTVKKIIETYRGITIGVDYDD